MLVVVRHILRQHRLQLPSAQDHQPVEQLTTSGANHREPAEELAPDQVEESIRHGRTSSRASNRDAKPQVDLGDDISGTYKFR
jgi:hypothetical protein